MLYITLASVDLVCARLWRTEWSFYVFRLVRLLWKAPPYYSKLHGWLRRRCAFVCVQRSIPPLDAEFLPLPMSAVVFFVSFVCLSFLILRRMGKNKVCLLHIIQSWLQLRKNMPEKKWIPRWKNTPRLYSYVFEERIAKWFIEARPGVDRKTWARTSLYPVQTNVLLRN